VSQFAGSAPAGPNGPDEAGVPGRTGPGGSDAAVLVVAVLVGAWAVGVTVALQAGGWLVEQLLDVEELAVPWWVRPAAGWLDAVLVATPAVLLATVPRPVSPARVAVRGAGRLWALGAVLLGVLGSLRAVPLAHNTLYLLLLTLVGAAAWVAVRRWYRPMPRVYAAYRPALPRAPVGALGVAAGLASLAPWLWLGALGGALETLFALTAAAAVGLLAGSALGPTFWLDFAASRRRLVLLGGLVAGVFLTLVAAGTGTGGVQLGELAALPPLGFAAAAIARGPRRPGDGGRWAGRRRPTPAGWMIGLATLGPLAFVEPVQVGLEINVGSRDVGFWALLAAGCALVAGLLCGAGLYPLRGPARRWLAASVAAVVAATGLVGYATVGAPGLHGDRLFVVMRAQDDLSDLSGVTDPAVRRDQVYRRLVDTADRTQAGLRRDLSRLHLSFTPYYLVNGVEVDGGPAVRAWLSGRSDVDRVLLAPQLRPVPGRGAPIAPDAPAPAGPQWNIKMIGADQVWARGDTGQGIVIGTSDTGVDAGAPALAGSLRPGDDSWFDPWNGTRTPTDHNGHGTHTIATALGRGGVGVAPGAQWIGCVDLDRNLGNPPDYLSCLQFMLAPFPHGADPLRDGDPSRGADVLTNSWGCPGEEGCDRDALLPAIDALSAAGVFVVAAAGNTGPRCGSITDPPAPYRDTFTVGAVDGSGAVADFSSRGPVAGATKPDVLAPGADVVSAVPGGYAVLSGTSMAAPHVAGVVALLWAADPRLVGDVGRTAAILRATASGASGDGCGGSAGVVDAYAAVLSAAGSP
jgi:subtilisin family serine protease